jgi:hypothetical protein
MVLNSRLVQPSIQPVRVQASLIIKTPYAYT